MRCRVDRQQQRCRESGVGTGFVDDDVVWPHTPLVAGAGDGADGEVDYTVGDGDIADHALGDARQDAVAVAGVLTVAAFIFGAGPKLQREVACRR